MHPTARKFAEPDQTNASMCVRSKKKNVDQKFVDCRRVVVRGRLPAVGQLWLSADVEHRAVLQRGSVMPGYHGLHRNAVSHSVESRPPVKTSQEDMESKPTAVHSASRLVRLLLNHTTKR